MENNIVSLYDEATIRGIIMPGRRVGNTTRMVDLAIQLMFEGKKIHLEDHVIGHKLALLHILDKLQIRIQVEHGGWQLMRKHMELHGRRESQIICFLEPKALGGLSKTQQNNYE